MEGHRSVIDGSERANSTRNELESVIGRMLWKEIWGPHVIENKWWWEDKEIVEECERLRTVWEFAVIEAAKEG
jgi:hypothetical protein